MTTHMNVKQAMARLNKSDASIRRYMRDGVLRYEKAGGHKYAPVLLLTADVERLAELQEQERRLLQEVTPSHGYEERIAWLEGKVLDLEAQIREMKEKSTNLGDLPATEPRTRPISKSGGLAGLPEMPEGWQSWKGFVTSHGLRADRIDNRDYVSTGQEYRMGRSRVKHPVDPAGQMMFIKAFWNNPHFHQCDREGCPCRY